MPKSDRGAAKAPSSKASRWGGHRLPAMPMTPPAANEPAPAAKPVTSRIRWPALALAWVMPRR